MLIIDDEVLMCLEEVEVLTDPSGLVTQETGRYVWLVMHCCGATVPLFDTYCGNCGMPME
jgi:hypothetical protein